MRRFTFLLGPIAAITFATSCAGTVYSSGDGYAGGGVSADLVYAAPGVQVIADYDEPIFFADSFYWRYDNDRWYRSRSYTDGWVYATAPTAVLQINQPRAYVHYRPQGWVDHRSRAQGPTVRDHRAAPTEPTRAPSHAAPPRREAPPREMPPERTRPAPKDKHHPDKKDEKGA